MNYENTKTRETNIPAVSINTMATELGELYSAAINSGMALKAIPSVFLWGAPGVGKSDGVRQIADRIAQGTGKKVVVEDIRLLLFSPIDLRGVPMADKSREFTQWLRPKLFDLDPSEGTVNILFLDELSAAPQSVQAAAYQITLDRTVGEHKLPDNTIVIAAGNRTTDRSVAYRIPNALANRMMHFQINVDFLSWKEWAVRRNIHPLIIGYLSWDPSKLYCEPQDNDVAYPTPRTWAFLSSLLYSRGILEEGTVPANMHLLIGSCIGRGAATEFEGWCNVYRELPSAKDIYSGKKCEYPRKQDVLYALVSSLVHYASVNSVSHSETENLCRFAERFPADFRTTLFRDLILIPEMRSKLARIPSFRTWMQKEGVKI